MHISKHSCLHRDTPSPKGLRLVLPFSYCSGAAVVHYCFSRLIWFFHLTEFHFESSLSKTPILVPSVCNNHPGLLFGLQSQWWNLTTKENFISVLQSRSICFLTFPLRKTYCASMLNLFGITCLSFCSGTRRIPFARKHLEISGCIRLFHFNFLRSSCGSITNQRRLVPCSSPLWPSISLMKFITGKI